MGLDNGIIRISKKVLPRAGNYNIGDYSDYFEDICYWRKCHDMRDDIMWNVFDNAEGQDYFEVDESNVTDIINAVVDSIIYAKDEDEEWVSGNWNKTNIGNLIIAKRDIISENPEYLYFFYDSY